MNKLSNCPFCGGEAHILNDYQNRRCVVVCDNCKANISVSYGQRKRKLSVTENDSTGGRTWTFESAKPEAIALWEKRPNNVVTIVGNDLPSVSPKDREVKVSLAADMNRESQIMCSFDKQNESTQGTIEKLLATIRGESITIARIYDLLEEKLK